MNRFLRIAAFVASAALPAPVVAQDLNADAQYELGARYQFGEGVPQDYAEAAKWYRLAAEQGHGSAQLSLAFFYFNSSRPQDHAEAVKWFRLAAEHRDTDVRVSAQMSLGTMYFDGTRVQRDYAEAAKWLRPLAEQGYQLAQFYLGKMYDFGNGVPQDYAEAVKWYRLAAEQGNASAQFSLGVMYANGEGVPQDYVLAHMWLNIGNANGATEAGKNRDFVAKQMTQEQLADAQARARVCMASGYQDCN